MPVITESPTRSASMERQRKKWTREECAAIKATGVWDQQKFELIEGELIDKMGKNRPHTNTLTYVREALARLFGWQYVNTETSINVASQDNAVSEPEPDLIVLARPTAEFTANPKPSDLRLVVEISDSSLLFDLEVKAPLYARAGIVEYWVFDVAAKELIAHRNPADGKYKLITIYGKQESVRPLAAPEQEFRVADAFPE